MMASSNVQDYHIYAESSFIMPEVNARKDFVDSWIFSEIEK